MANVDRHIGISAGWLAGPAAGVMLMGATLYFHFGPVFGCLAFWGGLAVLLCSLLAVVAHGLKERRPDKPVLGPAILVGLCLAGLCIAGAWYFWPSTSTPKPPARASIAVPIVSAATAQQPNATSKLKAASADHQPETVNAALSDHPSLKAQFSLEELDSLNRGTMSISVLYTNNGSSDVIIRGVATVANNLADIPEKPVMQAVQQLDHELIDQYYTMVSVDPAAFSPVFDVNEKTNLTIGKLISTTSNGQSVSWPVLISPGKTVDMRLTFLMAPVSPPYTGRVLFFGTRSVGSDGSERRAWCAIAAKYYLTGSHVIDGRGPAMFSASTSYDVFAQRPSC